MNRPHLLSLGALALVATLFFGTATVACAADAAGLLKAEIGQYIRTAWSNAPTNYAALKGAPIPGVAGHFRAKLPVGTFMKHCEVAGSGAARTRVSVCCCMKTG